ncbi:hypothetical protein NDU88_002688 [Pleurodeles waltl]|uniref:Uncharacterized protein n=1 Tax=Pleurodeles waltl TaxID=8319 RepID=A0AAV7P7H0_PLEWA|nr:hypothetical protein NDU88_002688 [Pleurodeles waltl]
MPLEVEERRFWGQGGSVSGTPERASWRPGDNAQQGRPSADCGSLSLDREQGARPGPLEMSLIGHGDRERPRQ